MAHAPGFVGERQSYHSVALPAARRAFASKKAVRHRNRRKKELVSCDTSSFTKSGRVRRDAMLDPGDEGREVGAADRPGSGGAEREDRGAAMADPGRMEQAVEVLHALEAGLIVMRLVALRHLAIIVEDAARIDELVVAADEGQELSAMRLESVERTEGIGKVGDVARAVLRHLRIGEAR